MSNEVKTRVLEQFTRDWWEVLIQHKEEISPVDWLLVIGTMTGMLVDSVTETEEEAAECLGHFTTIANGVAARFVDTAAVPPVH